MVSGSARLCDRFVVFGFGAGTAVLNPIIELSLQQRGVAPTLLGLGSLMLVLLLPLAQAYRYPVPHAPAQRARAAGKRSPTDDFTPKEMLRTRQWYVMYIGFSITILIVLIFGAQMKVLAREYALPAGTPPAARHVPAGQWLQPARGGVGL